VLIEPLDLESLVEPGEARRGCWRASLATPERTVFYGRLLITDRRLLFHTTQDHTRKGDWLEILHMRQRFSPRYPGSLSGYLVGDGPAAHLCIPRAEVTRVELLRHLLDRSVRLTLCGDRVVTLVHAWLTAKKIIQALG
jgi:hypothetical protein